MDTDRPSSSSIDASCIAKPSTEVSSDCESIRVENREDRSEAMIERRWE
jgi:hypothetical protein